MTLLELKNVVVQFPGVLALDGVDFLLRAGEVHAVVGQNGAGKSTLVKVIAGECEAQLGTFEYRDQERAPFRSPYEASREGVVIVTQERSLIPQMTVAENICIDQFAQGSLRRVNRRAIRASASAALRSLELDVDPNTLVGDLRPAEQTLVEIARAASRSASVLILDELTSAISESETQRLFALIRRSVAMGAGVVLISHRMSDIYGICDRVTVLQDGRVKYSDELHGVSEATLVQMMVSEEVELLPRDRSDTCDRTPEPSSGNVLRAELGASDDGRGYELECRAGELLGIFGLVGSGAIEVAYELVGGTDGDSLATLNGQAIRGVSGAVALGVGFVPADRSESILDLQSLRRNIGVSQLRQFRRGPLFSKAKEREQALEISRRLDIRPNEVERGIETFSGGNKQKSVVGRWLRPEIAGIIAAEPTRGVDIHARETIHAALREMSASGACVVVASTDLDEVVRISDRVVVFAHGRPVAEFSSTSLTQEAVLSAAVTG